MDREISEDSGADSGANPGTTDGTDSIHTVIHGLVTQTGNRGKLHVLFSCKFQYFHSIVI